MFFFRSVSQYTFNINVRWRGSHVSCLVTTIDISIFMFHSVNPNALGLATKYVGTRMLPPPLSGGVGSSGLAFPIIYYFFLARKIDIPCFSL